MCADGKDPRSESEKTLTSELLVTSFFERRKKEYEAEAEVKIEAEVERRMNKILQNFKTKLLKIELLKMVDMLTEVENT